MKYTHEPLQAFQSWDICKYRKFKSSMYFIHEFAHCIEALFLSS